MSWGCLQHSKHKHGVGGLTNGDENRARAGGGKEKKHLPWVSSRAVGREEHEKDREREEKREKVNIPGEKRFCR